MKVSRPRIMGLPGRFRGKHILATAFCALATSCVPQVQSATLDPAPAERPIRTATAPAAVRSPLRSAPVRTTPVMRSAATPYAAPTPPRYTAPVPPPISPQLAAAQRSLDSQLASLGRAFNGDVGIAVRDVQTGWTSHFDGASHFPQQSVSKFWVSLTALDKADRGELSLTAPVTVRRSDLTLFNQPIAALVKGDGYQTTLGALIHRAITQSDNTANDFVLWRAGGPDAVRNYFLNKRITGVRFGPGERVMQARIAGMEWRPSMVGSGFYAARSSLPMSVRRSALDTYLDDPVDGATPIGLVDALTRLKKGELLSAGSTQRLLSIMSNTRTGPRRLKGGLAPGWRLAHKTGTGQVLGGTSTGYNDIGIVTSPDGRSYAVAVMIRSTSAPIPQRMALMQNAVRAIIDYDRNARGYNIARNAPAYMPSQPAYADEDDYGEE